MEIRSIETERELWAQTQSLRGQQWDKTADILSFDKVALFGAVAYLLSQPLPAFGKQIAVTTLPWITSYSFQSASTQWLNLHLKTPKGGKIIVFIPLSGIAQSVSNSKSTESFLAGLNNDWNIDPKFSQPVDPNLFFKSRTIWYQQRLDAHTSISGNFSIDSRNNFAEVDGYSNSQRITVNIRYKW